MLLPFPGLADGMNGVPLKMMRSGTLMPFTMTARQSLCATLLESRLDPHLVLNGRLVHAFEFFENLRGQRLQLLGSQVLPLDGALAWRRWIALRADLTSALHERLPKLRQRPTPYPCVLWVAFSPRWYADGY